MSASTTRLEPGGEHRLVSRPATTRSLRSIRDQVRVHPHLLRRACATHYYESRILVDDLFLSRSCLTIRRHHGLRVIHLDEVTASLLNLWLHERYGYATVREFVG
jgi:hypothetical protein